MPTEHACVSMSCQGYSSCPNLYRAIALLDTAVVWGMYCPVHMSELSSHHCPILVHVAIQHHIARDVRQRMIKWECFGPALFRQLPERDLLDTAQQVDKAVVLFDTTYILVMELSSQ